MIALIKLLVNVMPFSSVVVRPRTLRSRPRPGTSKFFRGQGHTSRGQAKDMQVEVKAKDMDQGQRAFFRFQYEISKCGSFGREIMVRKQFMA